VSEDGLDQTTLDASEPLRVHRGPPSVLTILHAPNLDARFSQRRVGDRTWLGRSVPEAEGLSLADDRVSRQHAVLVRREDDLLEVRDLESHNGTFVDGARVETAVLSAGSILRLGDTLLELGTEPLAGHSVDAGGVVGHSAVMDRVRSQVAAAARSRGTVLLLGETGTGKELLARRIHDLGGSTGEFVAVNCPAIPNELVEASLFGHKRGAFTGAIADARGTFGRASGGTLFLDEIGELPLHHQPKLLRVIETREFTPVGGAEPVRVDLRIIAATNADLAAALEAGYFRRDLYTRLAELIIRIPPLRHRRADIPLLAEHFLARSLRGRSMVLTAGFMEDLVLHAWPGNVRELRSVVQRLCMTEDDPVRLGRRALREAMDEPAIEESGPTGTGATGSEPQRAPNPKRIGRTPPPREELHAVLTRYRGNVTKVALHYGKAPAQVYRWMARYGLDPETFRDQPKDH